MALTYGFYNSLNHDRVYDANDFGSIYDGVINDGVFMNIGTGFVVKANGSNTLKVGIGRAWFNGTWTYNDSILSMTAPPSDVLYKRMDALVIEVNKTTRINDIRFVQGTPATNPVAPRLTKSTYVNQYPLCYITRYANTEIINQADVRNMVGTAECPWVTGILKTISMSELIGQWENELDLFVQGEEREFTNWSTQKKQEYTEWIAVNEREFLDWFQRMQELLNADAVGHMQNLIDDALGWATGFLGGMTKFNSNGSITETRGAYTNTITFNSNGTITERLVNSRDNVTKTKTTTFNSDGSINYAVT